MKFLCVWGTVACLFTATQAVAQTTAPLNQHPVEKALLFNQLPEKIACPVQALQQIFSNNVNGPVNLQLGSDLKVEGVVLAKANVSADQLSINIRCSNYQNALLNLSRLTQPDGSYSYVGRMVSLRHGDVLLLWESNGQYAFIREKQLLTMVE